MPPATPAVARVWIAEVPILAWLTIRNIVAKPSMRFSNKGSAASGVTLAATCDFKRCIIVVLCTLAAIIKARWICEQAHQQMKEELGLDHFEGRSWQGLHRHALMTMIAYAFLQHRRLAATAPKKKNQRAPASANFARRAPRHSRTFRSTTAASSNSREETAAMPA